MEKVYDRNVVNKYRLYLFLGIIIHNLIDFVYIYTTVCFLVIQLSSIISRKIYRPTKPCQAVYSLVGCHIAPESKAVES